MKNIRCQGIDIPIAEKLFINKDGCSGEILVAEHCQNAGSKCNGVCKKCYGILALVKVDEFDKDIMGFNIKSKLLRDTFSVEKNDVVKTLTATDFINSCEIISRAQKDTKNNYGSMSSPWFYGDAPVTWATDCAECRIKYKDSVTPCKNVEQNQKDGKLDNFCGEQKQRVLSFY